LLPVTTEPRNPDALRFTFQVLRRFFKGLVSDDIVEGPQRRGALKKVEGCRLYLCLANCERSA